MTFARACTLTDVPQGTCLAASVAGQDVAIVHGDSGVFAIRDECSHGDYPLSEGEVEGDRLECVLHGSQFDLATGEPLTPPASEPVPVYPVRVEGDYVLVDVDSPIAIN